MNKKVSGVYKITNKVNNKSYIGSSINIKMRWQKHIYDLKKDLHPNKHLLESYKKYGEHNFEFSILEIVEDTDQLIDREQYYLDFYKSYENGYNIRKFAENNFGYKHSKKTIEKCRIASTGKQHTEETKKRISLSNIGKIVSEETKKKMSLAKKGKSSHWKGKKRSEKQKKIISDMAKKRIGELNPNSKIKNADIEKIKFMFYQEKIKINTIAESFEVSRSTIKRILHDKRAYTNQ